jgi:propionate catabolism operon transcriptional regulator
MDQVFRIGFINSTQQFLDTALSVASQRNVTAATALAGLDAAIPAGKKMEQEGVEMIISRRATADILRKSMKIPVLSVRISVHDILLNIREASLMGKKILLTSFPEQKIEDSELLEDVFHVTLIPGVFHDYDSLKDAIRWGKRQGCDIVIGGGVSMPLAKEHGMLGVELKTNEDAIISAIDDAISVVRANREEQEKTLRYKVIMDATSEGILAIDKNGIISSINRAAVAFLRLPGSPVGQEFTKCFPSAFVRHVLNSGRPLLNRLEKFGNDQFLASYIPLQAGSETVGEVITFRDVPNLVRAENEVRRSLVKGHVSKHTIEDFIHKNEDMKKIIENVKKISLVNSTALITGETGTGKEIIAQSIHAFGPRRKGPFVSINCAAIPDQLLESELFGYEEGAFTGSRHGGKSGLFELAHHGTIFLDEVGATSLSVQSRLLRVLQEREVMRIGGDRLIPVDVRVIAATNQDLWTAVQKGSFREDLYFRLDVLTIHIPPLRERIEDLPFLAKDLARRCARSANVQDVEIPARCLEKLMNLQWPGNVRQLQNFIEKLVILCEGSFKTDVFEDLYATLLKYSQFRETDSGVIKPALSSTRDQRPGQMEAGVIRKALEECGFCRTKAARKLGMSRTTLWRKLREMEIVKDSSSFN